MGEEEEGEVFSREATTSHWWEDCLEEKGGSGCMANSRSWAEELQDIFVPQTEDQYSGARTRQSSISVSYWALSLCLGHTSIVCKYVLYQYIGVSIVVKEK